MSNSLVIGAGAIGCLVAGRLAQAGQRVTLLARSTATELRSQGVTISQDGASQTSFPRIVTADLLPAEPPALVILTVKGYDTAGLLGLLDQLRPQRVLSLQNGLGNEETLAATLGPERVLAGTITTSVEVITPTSVLVTKQGGVGVATLDGSLVGPWVDHLQPLAPLVRSYPNWQAMKWSKVLLNMLGNATAALLGWNVMQVYADRRLVALERAAFLEAVQVMRTLGLGPVNLPRYPVRSLVALMRWLPLPLLQPALQRLIARGRGGKPPSLLLDLQRGRTQSEGALLYGAISAAAEGAGIRAPINAQLARLLAAVTQGEQPWSSLRDQPAELLHLLKTDLQH